MARSDVVHQSSFFIRMNVGLDLGLTLGFGLPWLVLTR